MNQIIVVVGNEETRKVKMVISKTSLGNNIYAIYAISYRGNNWSDYAAVYELDKFENYVNDVIESFIGVPLLSKFHHIYDDLFHHICNFCDLGDNHELYLKKIFFNSIDYDSTSKYYENNWEWHNMQIIDGDFLKNNPKLNEEDTTEDF